jgi:ferredoxin/flavodoxin---NADP+ reductase
MPRTAAGDYFCALRCGKAPGLIEELMHKETVFVVGAGPAGLFAARKIAAAGYQVEILNRDIRPGGLAEYGIYPMKFHMKSGLRKQFAKILAMPNVEYLGNVAVGSHGAFSIDALRGLNPAAVVFAVGAQGTKKLGLPGEDARGVYSAKDFVYHYNRLPPFTSQDFSTGRRVAIIGMGNVMVDIARWLLIDQPGPKPDEVSVIARRGPFEVKFDSKEFDYVEPFLDRMRFRDELSRIAPSLRACGQDVDEVSKTTFPWLQNEPSAAHESKLTFRFLSSPVAVEPGAQGRIEKLKVAENDLIREGDAVKPKTTDRQTDLEFDTLIFAIGDVADPSVGLPYGRNEYLTNPDPTDADRAAYEVFDGASGKVLEGIYVVGWARKASEGLVGKARLDAERGCEHILKHLENQARSSPRECAEIRHELSNRGNGVVSKDDVTRLLQAEADCADKLNQPGFRYSTNQEMLQAIHAQ